MEAHGKGQVLVVDDDAQLRDLLVLVLRHEGFVVRVAASADEALAELSQGQPDLVILDVSLGQGDGRAVLAEMRRAGDLPVIMISAFGDAADRVLALRLGADDYLVKPFSPAELVARTESVLRRATRIAEVRAPQSADLVIDDRTREARLDGVLLELTPKEFDLLAFLSRSSRQVFTRGQLLEHVWGSQSGWQSEATVTEHVRRLRRKLEQDPDHPRRIVTVRGVGYRFESLASSSSDATRPQSSSVS